LLRDERAVLATDVAAGFQYRWPQRTVERGVVNITDEIGDPFSFIERFARR